MMNLVAEANTSTQAQNLNGSLLEQFRSQGRSLFEEKGLPAPKHEEYKYTPIAKVLEKNFPNGFGTNTATEIPELSSFSFPMEAYRLVLLDGQYQEALSNLPSADQLSIRNLADAAGDADFSLQADPAKDTFIALNQANLGNGLQISIAKNIQLAKPLLIQHLLSAAEGSPASMPRIQLSVGRFSEVKLVEVYTTLGTAASFSNSLTEISLDEQAQVMHYIVQTSNDQAIQVNTTEVHQQAHSRYTATTITLGGSLVRNNLNIALDAENAEANMYGLYMLHGKQHVDNHTVVDHRKPNCLSNELYKGIMDDSSTGVFNGKIYVRPQAQKTNAFQSNKNILLTDNATINTKPQLEIWADDVKCSHGATTGQLDDEQIFYLRARGISEDTARRMLLYAFAADIFDHIDIEPLKEHFLAMLADKFDTNKEA